MAERRAVPFVDLDADFTTRNGDISTDLAVHGHDAYAEQHVSVYSALVGEPERLEVIALSSGFMMDRHDVHPDHIRWRQRIASSVSTRRT